MKSLQDFKTLVEEEKSDYSKFDMLVRAGLANKAQLARIHRILDKMTEERPQFNNADREIMRNLFNKMVDLIANNKQIFQRTKQAVREEVEQFDEAAPDVTNMPPYVLILKRKAIRYYPNDTRVALYHNQRLDKYFSIPYGTGIDGVIQAEEVESLDELNTDTVKRYKSMATLRAVGQASNIYDREVEGGQKPDPKQHAALAKTKQGLARADARLNKEHSDTCPVCGQTPCNCTHIEESVMDTLHKIVAGKSAQSVKFASGESRKVDHYTASAITQIHKAVNDDNKKKLADMVHKSPAHFEKVAAFAFSKAK